MDDDRHSPLTVATEGVLAGMAGALTVTVLVAAGRWAIAGRDGRSPVLATPADERITAGQVLSEGPDLPANMNRVTAIFVQKLATGLFGASLDADQQYLAGTLWHLAYGGFWGLLYALWRGSLPLPPLALGPAHGLLVWAVGPGWLVPKMGLMLPPGRQRPRTTALVAGIHAAYGLIVALLVALRHRAVPRSAEPR
jgi:hypothetical protein